VGTLSLHDLWIANYGGFFLSSVAFILFWIIFNCAQSIRQFRRSMQTDQIAYGARRPPTMRRIVQTICGFTYGIAFLIPITFEAYFVGHRPTHPIPSEGRTYQLDVHGYIAYLTSREHVLVSYYWLLFAGICFLLGAYYTTPSRPS
jgi:hypothetical protein